MRAANLALRFLLELAALVGLGWWASKLDASLPVRAIAAASAIGAFVVAWGALVAPKARRRLPDPRRLLLEVLLFGSAATAVVSSGSVWIGIAFAVMVAVNEALLFAWDQRVY